MNMGSFDKIGTTGYAMINKSLERLDALAEGIDGDDPKSAAKGIAEMAKARVQLVQGMTLVNAYEDLLSSTLRLFGIGCRCNCRC